MRTRSNMVYLISVTTRSPNFVTSAYRIAVPAASNAATTKIATKYKSSLLSFQLLNVSTTLRTANGSTNDKPAVRISAKQAAAINPL